jgi:hypothetical protein
MPAITSANLANAIVKMVAVDALPALTGNLVMGNLVNRDYEPTIAQAGDTVNIPIPPTLVANNIAEGGTVVKQNPSLGNAQIVLNTHAEATFQIPDVTKVIAVPDLLRLYMQPAVIALAEKIESDLLGLYSGFTANPAVGTAGTAITEAAIDTAETALFQAKVPASSPKYLVVDGNTYSQLRQIPRFSEYSTAGDAGLPFAVRAQNRLCSDHDAEHGVHEVGDRPRDAPYAPTSAGHRRVGGVRGNGQLRHSRADDLCSGHSRSAIHC